MSFAVRTALTSDIPAMRRVRGKVRENRLTNPHGIPEDSYLPFVVAGSAWVAQSGAEIVGFAAIEARSKSVWAFFVDPAAESAGIGRALHVRMVEWAREQGLDRLSLSTEDGTRAAQFYARAGWTRKGMTDEGEVHFELSLRS